MSTDQQLEKECRKGLRAARRIVIKLGTSTVTEPSGELCEKRVMPIVRGIAGLLAEGRQVVLVTSGAVGLGRWAMGLHSARLKDMAVKQACAAAGQGLLMAAYKKLFEEHGAKVAQVLLTEEDFSNWRRYSNLRRTMEKLIGSTTRSESVASTPITRGRTIIIVSPAQLPILDGRPTQR